jgi:hypothetical protein
MVGLLVLLFPLLLMAFMLLMERVESPLRKVAVENQVEEFLDTAHPDEVDTLVIEGLASALQNWENRRQRRGFTRLLPLPNKSQGRRSRPTTARHRAPGGL